ncbi:MAG: hypothetical protein KDA42_05945 [Planctomycetales bacterium]|nr:hypothetical protein [Planctomycetales bacterium]
MAKPRDELRRQMTLYATIGTTVVVEAITIALRFGAGADAVSFNKSAPLLLQIHHMFWSIPILVALPLTWRRSQLSGLLLGVALGFVFSDLLHHFLVLPLTVGNTGWHWP